MFSFPSLSLDDTDPRSKPVVKVSSVGVGRDTDLKAEAALRDELSKTVLCVMFILQRPVRSHMSAVAALI